MPVSAIETALAGFPDNSSAFAYTIPPRSHAPECCEPSIRIERRCRSNAYARPRNEPSLGKPDGARFYRLNGVVKGKKKKRRGPTSPQSSPPVITVGGSKAEE